MNNVSVSYFDSYGVEHIPKKKKKVIRNEYIKPNIFRIQAYHSIICSYFSIGFIDFMLTGKRLTGFTNIFPWNKLKKWWYSFILF